MATNQLNNANESDKLSIRLSISDWKGSTFGPNALAYRAEGNNNLVIAIKQQKLILRLKKIVKGSNKTDDDELEKMRDSLKYVKLFTLLLAAEFKVLPQITELMVNDYDEFNRWLLPYRPEQRREKEVRCRYGFLYPDVAFMPKRLSFDTNAWHAYQPETFCVEIKPKQGWTLNNCNPNPFRDIDLNNVNKCRYCAMQYWKLNEGKICKISHYCPIDLFSGPIFDSTTDPSSINGIVGDVFKKQNTNELNEFIDLIVSILRKDFNSIDACDVPIVETEDNEKRCCIESPANSLPANCILKQILDIQLLAKSCVWCVDDLKETHSNSMSSEFVKNFQMKVLSDSNAIRETSERGILLGNLSKIECYTLGATAMDCSIMLTFQRINDADPNNITTDDVRKHIIHIGRDATFLVNATVVDLDPKTPLEHFTKYIKQTNRSHKAYLETLKNK